MPARAVAAWLLAQEARALLARLDRVKPFALQETMVPAAAISHAAQSAIEGFLMARRLELRRQAGAFLRWIAGPDGRRAAPADAQRRLTFLRMRFNSVLTQIDIFGDVMTQRSEHDSGVWLAGLDVLASDALALPGRPFRPPPVVCHLSRDYGAAIRRARTRLPGGGGNPVAVLRLPRERMIGTGVGASIGHEVGHEGSARLGLVNSMRPVFRGLQRTGGEQRIVWQYYERWLGEILADLWAVARLGFASTLGLLGVLSLPRAFVFRLDKDAHPSPWLRLKLACRLGEALYPDPCWRAMTRLWESLYPPLGLRPGIRRLFAHLEDGLSGLVAVVVGHRPRSLAGKSLGEILPDTDRHPMRLSSWSDSWCRSPGRLRDVPPTLAVAALGQARAEGRITAEQESHWLAGLLTHWALRRSLGAPRACTQCIETIASR